jgi:hypothetical protein
MIIATELLHRLAPASSWANILEFQYSINGVQAPTGHAVAVWKIKGDSNVIVADDDGSYNLTTTSTALPDVIEALEAKLSSAAGVLVSLSHARYALNQ